MCGIAGFWVAPGSQDAETMFRTVTRMADVLAHRGPDDHGIWADPDTGLAFAHRRLAIQDVSPLGHQPMRSASGRFWLIFNGEIYNFRELAHELKGLGHDFSGGSDTEVMLAAFESWGPEAALKRFTGMFAFALWDTDTRRLWLARDRMGEKPLYYGWVQGAFLFGSELKALRQFPDFSAEIDRDVLPMFLRYGYVPDPWSIYKGLYKLAPGSSLVLNDSGYRRPGTFSPSPEDHTQTCKAPNRYWSLQDVASQAGSGTQAGENEVVDRLESLLRAAIRRQMIADVPLGAFLSGGIDSSAVVAVMQAESSLPVRTFTIGFDQAEFNEAEHAKAVAGHLGTDHHELYVTGQDALDLVPQLPGIYDEPFADASQLPSILVAKMAREHVKVCLSGDGGDELFCGYNRYIWGSRIAARMTAMPAPLRHTLGKLITTIGRRVPETLLARLSGSASGQAGALPGARAKLAKLVDVLECTNASDAYHRLVSYWHDPNGLVIGGNEPPKLLELLRHPGIDTDLLGCMMLWDQRVYLPGDNLTKVDRASMSVSLETRLPLLDHQIVEFSWEHEAAKFRSAPKSKWILRQMLYRFVPPELIDRPKMGFSVPIAQWISGPLREWAADLLSEDTIRRAGYLEHRPIDETLRGLQDGNHQGGADLWAVLMFQAWLENHLAD